MPLERKDRIRLLEVASESGAAFFDLIDVARDLEAYVLGKPVPIRRKRLYEDWEDMMPTEQGH